MRPKYHDGMVALIAAFVIWVLLIGCAVWCGFVRADAEGRIAETDAERREAEHAAAVLMDQLEQRALLPEGMAEPVALGEYMCTAYCAEEYPHICGGNGITASGTPITSGLTVAVDPEVIPLGTVLYIEGVGVRIAQDTGSAIKGQKIDVAIETHAEAERWAGYGTHRVWLLQGGD